MIENKVNTLDINALAEMTDEQLIEKADQLFNISDEIINNNLKSGITGKKKLSAAAETEMIVKAYIANRTDKNWKQLQERFWYGIMQYAFGFVKSWSLAEDMTIETFMKALKAIDSFDPDKAKFSTWLWTICRNNCLLYLKQESKLPAVDSDISDIYDSTIMSSCKSQGLTSSEYIVGQQGDLVNVSSDEITQKLYDASIAEIENIGGTAGMILNMKLVQNMKIREIGEELHMNESTVKNYLYKGKENLNNIMMKKHRNLYEMYMDSCAEKDQLEI
jgi:RNA polymerase sigma-70 factor (ECF subfamily)